jgi:hypothetical protein
MDTSRDREAITRAERQTDIHIDFELEDIIAGNLPASDVGKRILSIVEDSQGLPTQGKIEAALTPLYETMTADFYRQEGGTGESPGANRQSVKELAAKVIQARKVKRTAMARASRGPAARGPGPGKRALPVTGFQLGLIACLIALLLLVFTFKS